VSQNKDYYQVTTTTITATTTTTTSTSPVQPPCRHSPTDCGIRFPGRPKKGQGVGFCRLDYHDTTTTHYDNYYDDYHYYDYY